MTLELEKHILEPVIVGKHLGAPFLHLAADASPAMLIIVRNTLNPVVTIVRRIIIIMELWACL